MEIIGVDSIIPFHQLSIPFVYSLLRYFSQFGRVDDCQDSKIWIKIIKHTQQRASEELDPTFLFNFQQM